MSKESRVFEISINERDSNGVPTGKVLNFESDSAYKIWEFNNKISGHKRRTKSNSKIKTNQSPQSILNQVNNTYAKEVIKKKRQKFDDEYPRIVTGKFCC